MQKIGLRTIKSAVAVFICFCISSFFIKDGYPFYSAIAALISMQKDVGTSIKTGKNRIIGTFVGGIIGLIVDIVCTEAKIVNHQILYYFILSLFIIVVIHTAVLLKSKGAAYISCVVFLCITVMHKGEQSPYIFALTRVVETLLGIIVSILVNMYNPYVKPDENVLFVTDLDGTLLNKDKKIPEKCVKIINHQIKRGMKFTAATARTPATLKQILKDINFNLPVICMGGGAVYDVNTGKIDNCIYMERYAYDNIVEAAKKYDATMLTYTVSDNRIYVYYSDINNEPIAKFCRERENLEMKTFVKGDISYDSEPIYVMFLDKTDKINKMYKEFKKCHYSKLINLSCYEDIYEDGYSYLEIYAIKASKAEGLLNLQKLTNTVYTVAFGDNNNDISMLRTADYSYAVENATNIVKNVADEIIDTNDDGAVGKVLKSFKVHSH